MHAVAGIQTRAGQPDAATKTLASAGNIEKTQNLFPVVVPAFVNIRTASSVTAFTRIGSAVPVGGIISGATVETGDAPELMLDRFIPTMQVQRNFQIAGATTNASIALSGNVANNVKGFLQSISTTADIGLLTGFGRTYVETVAYLPHMYFFVIPMAIGDCLDGMGSYSEAESYYAGTLVYPFINRRFEIVKLWNKLANLYLEMGDLAYRNAKDSVADFATAKVSYEKIIKTDKTLNNASPLYSDPKFADIKNRVSAFIAGGLSPAADNHKCLSRSLMRLSASPDPDPIQFFWLSGNLHTAVRLGIPAKHCQILCPTSFADRATIHPVEVHSRE